MKKVKNMASMLTFGLALAAALFAPASTIASSHVDAIVLDRNRSVDVPAGETNTVYVISGGAWHLTKTGGGRLVVNSITASGAKLSVLEGTFEIAGMPDGLPDAFFHVDAMATSSLVTETRDGTNYVTRWNDVRGEGRPYAARTIGNSKVGNNDPWLGTDETTGKPVVDFGTTWNSSTRSDGWGAALKWSEDVTRPMDIFVVERHSSDMRQIIADNPTQTGTPYRNQALLGSTSAASLCPGNPMTGYGSVPVVIYGALFAHGLAEGVFRVDGGEEKGYSWAEGYRPGYDQHVYGIYPSKQDYIEGNATMNFNAFASERNRTLGGQTIAEAIVFTNLLTDAQREQMNRYLMTKWKPVPLAELTLGEGAVVSIPDGITLSTTLFVDNGGTVSGGGVLSPVVSRTADSIVMSGGSLVDDPLAAADAWFHVDASKTDSFVLADGSNTEVSRWNDVRGSGWRYADAFNGNNVAVEHRPYIVPGYTNGFSVLDFGPGWENGRDASYKIAMRWSETCETPRTLLAVVEDRVEMREWQRNLSDATQKRNQAFFGSYTINAAANNQIFLGRGNRSNDDLNSPYVLGNGYGKNATVYCDGTRVNAPASNAFPDGLHVVSIETYEEDVLAGNQKCNMFACERGNIYGGQRLAEALVFTNSIAAAERQRYEALLSAKWLDGSPLANTVANVVITNGASYELKYQSLEATSSLTIGGTVAAECVIAPSSITITEPSSIVGSLALPNGVVTVTLKCGDWSGYPVWSSVKVLGATSVTGSPDFVVQPEPELKKRKVVLKVRSDGIYADIFSNGLFIICK